MEKENNRLVEYVRVIRGSTNGKNKTNGYWGGWSWGCDMRRDGNSRSDAELEKFLKMRKEILSEGLLSIIENSYQEFLTVSCELLLSVLDLVLAWNKPQLFKE